MLRGVPYLNLFGRVYPVWGQGQTLAIFFLAVSRLKLENQILGQAVENLKRKHESTKRDLDIFTQRVKHLEVYTIQIIN